MTSSLFDSCFGDLPLNDRQKLKKTLNQINKICGLEVEE